MAGTTPIQALPYPDPTDPLAEGADKIKELALALDQKMIGASLASVLAGTPTPAGRLIIEAGTAVITTNAPGAGVLTFVRPAAALLTVLVDTGDDADATSAASFDYHPAYCQVMYKRNGAPVANAGVRINYAAFFLT